MNIRNVTLAALAFATVAFAQNDTGFQVRYAANLAIGDSIVDITNTGANGASALGPGFGAASGNICVNVYALDYDEELVSCCSCLVTPDQTVSLSAQKDLISNPLTSSVPTSVTIKLVATLAGTGGSGTGMVCNNSAGSIAGTGSVVTGMAAWGTTLHANTSAAAGTYALTETPFTPATLSAGELTSLVGRCASIIGNGSHHGICNSCALTALGGTKL